MLPLWPTVVSNLNTLVPVANQFAASTPDILQILANQTTTANDRQRPGLRGPPGHRRRRGPRRPGGPAPHRHPAALRRPGRRLRSVPDRHLAEPRTRSPSCSTGLDAWANAWTAAEASGPYLDLTQTEVVANPADLGLAVLGGPQAAAYLSAGLGPGYVNPPTYSSAGTIRPPTTDLVRRLRRPRRSAAGSGSGGGRTGADPGRVPRSSPR